MNAFKVFLSLNLQKQIVAVLAVIITIAALTLLTRQTLKPNMDLLYSGLDSQIAGEVIAELSAKNIAYEVKGSAIYAQADKRDALRLELAKEGLPRQNMSGYELFDNINSFAMTSDMFDTAYWRAKEGELARTILALPAVDLARVHLGTAKSATFSNSPTSQSASVTLRASGGINRQTAKAVQYLTALSVAGLQPSDVVVIDARLGIVAGPGSDGNMLAGQNNDGLGGLERAARIKKDLLAIMEARVGSGNARVSVMLDVERISQTMKEHTYDPNTRVVKSKSTTEITDTSTGKSTAVSVASNLPEGAAGGGSSNSNRGEITETVQYEISELVKSSTVLPGAIKHLSVAILVNDIQSIGEDGNPIVTPRSETELSSLRDLALASAGINEERGDVLTLKSIAFETPDLTGAIEKPSIFSQFLEHYMWSMIQAGFLGFIVLILGIFVVRPLFSSSQVLTDEQGILSQMDVQVLAGEKKVKGLPAPVNDQTQNTLNPTEDPIDLLKSITQENPDDAAALLSSWLEMEATTNNAITS